MTAARRFARELIVYEDQAVLVVPSLHQKRGNHGHCLVITRERYEGDDFDVAEYQRLSERTRIDQAEAVRRTWKSPDARRGLRS